ncbi:tetratricopeptide repeat protein [Acinetobacter piscicola]|uniref:tetratricopeptide repeat protein n=1 Tax=Acinetobacter piscicola TaxID=2006115 RepID=UPI00101FF28D|nr:tetratricopeptide repeat protein [Acinetobacter piscicola]RYL24941.1 sel1 repeat family protein [Acinetobacter piscicola]
MPQHHPHTRLFVLLFGLVFPLLSHAGNNGELQFKDICQAYDDQNKMHEFNQCIEDFLAQTPELVVNDNDQIFEKAEQFRLGLEGITDHQLALKYYQQAAENGHTQAQTELATIYAEGEIVKRDLNQSFKWLSKAAEQNDALAQFLLGKLYLNDHFEQKNPQKAIVWITKSAHNDNRVASYDLGVIYHEGKIIQKDLDRAIYWYKYSANLGYSPAQLHLVNLYQLGYGTPTPENKALAQDMYQEKIDSKSVQAFMFMAESYHYGRNDFPLDLQLARQWYQNAANLGLTEAKERLKNLK